MLNQSTIPSSIAQTWYAQHRLYWTPRPLGAFAPETKFSETRAMAHTFHLASTIGDRQARRAARGNICNLLVAVLIKPVVHRWYQQCKVQTLAFCVYSPSRTTKLFARLVHITTLIASAVQLTEPGNAAAAAYLYGHAQQLAELANRRTDMSAQVHGTW